MANKETYLEYRETFPRMVGELRDTPVEDPKYLPYAGFIFSNEQRILDMAEWLAGRKRFHDAAEKAETASEYRIAAGLFSRLGDASDLVLIGKKDEAYNHLTKTIVTLASMSNEGDAQ